MDGSIGLTCSSTPEDANSWSPVQAINAPFKSDSTISLLEHDGSLHLGVNGLDHHAYMAKS